VDAENESISALTVRQELGVVCYESNILGSRGPRKMSAIVPAVRRVITTNIAHHIHVPADLPT
jgi:hypothetical protein